MSVAKVAIITRTRDRGAFLERAIQSVHRQTMKDFIHVIINDAGDEDAVNVLIEKHKDITRGRVKVIHNKASSGMEAASNKAIEHSRSLYVAIHDDDDTWHPDFLKIATSELDCGNYKGVVMLTDKIIEQATEAGIVELSRERFMPDMKAISLYNQCLENQLTPITFIYARSVFDEIGYYDETLPVAGDWEFGLRFLTKYDVGIVRSDEALAYYHHRPASSGDAGNAVLQKRADYDLHINRIMNRYLRNDISLGHTGLGVIMNQARHLESEVKRLKDGLISDLWSQGEWLRDKTELIQSTTLETKHALEVHDSKSLKDKIMSGRKGKASSGE